MKKSVLLFLCAVSLFAADYAAEGKLWWAHIQYLADDKLQGRDVGSEGFQMAVQYVSTQFERLGLKPARCKALIASNPPNTPTVPSYRPE